MSALLMKITHTRLEKNGEAFMRKSKKRQKDDKKVMYIDIKHVLGKKSASASGSRFPRAPGFECIAITNSASPRANPVKFSPELKHGSENMI